MFNIIERVIPLALGTVATAFLGYMTYLLQQDKFDLDNDKACIDTAKAIAASPNSQTDDQTPDIARDVVMRRCKLETKEEAIKLIRFFGMEAEHANSREYVPVIPAIKDGVLEPVPWDFTTQDRPMPLATPTAQPSPQPGVDAGDYSGFVALGKVEDKPEYKHNFEVVSAGTKGNWPPQTGDIIRAKWSVNLRGNTLNTTNGKNPVLEVVSEGQCMVIANDASALRGQYWAAVDYAECPDEGAD